MLTRDQVAGAAVGLDELGEVARRASRRRARARPRRPRRCRGSRSGPRGTPARRPRWRRCRRTGRCRPARRPRGRAGASRKVSVSGSWNSSVRELERRHRRRGALGVGQRVGDRDAHVGVAEMRDRGAVAEADEPVHDRRRVDHDLDPVVGDAEEEVRLDHLEALVRERGRVDRDLRPHRPGRVRERLLGGDRRELVGACGRGTGPPLAVRTIALRARRAARTGRAPSARCRPGSAHRRPAPCACERELAGGDEALLVRERERDAVLERPHRRRSARRSRRPRSGRRRARRARAARSGLPRSASAARARRSAASPEVAATSSSSGCASITSIAWRPIEPVAPSRAIRFIPSG